MRHQVTTADRRIAAIAENAFGVVTHEELVGASVTLGEIRARLNRGSLLPVFRGVYRVGHMAPSTEATYIAAVKACGDGAVLSGRAAAHLFGLIKGRPPTADVTAPTKRRVKGITTHRSTLHPSDRTIHNRIPTTTPARTIVDLAATLPERA